MIEWLFTFLVVYLLYKLVFDFIVPVYRTSAQMRDKMNQMNQQQQNYQQHTSAKSERTADKTTVRPPAEDYIDFEEVK